ncbi:MAG: manganese efflux pump [Armatimonadetes bacterium]|nr:manganese efflux pump [Armatimonadota bacterium]
MMAWMLILGIALANNLDNTSVGIAYGVARIRLPLRMNLWVAVLTFLITGSAAALGSRLAHLLPVQWAHILSAAILCVIGATVLLPALRRGDGAAPPVRRVRSDRIGFSEATFLGIALSINNIGGGVSAGLLRLSTPVTALCSALLSFLVLWLGNRAGHRLGRGRLGEHAQLAAGMLLILIGLCQFH